MASMLQIISKEYSKSTLRYTNRLTQIGVSVLAQTEISKKKGYYGEIYLAKLVTDI